LPLDFVVKFSVEGFNLPLFKLSSLSNILRCVSSVPFTLITLFFKTSFTPVPSVVALVSATARVLLSLVASFADARLIF
jgi:hypothetical protein